jgi:F0F1-type ATP synthase membrane subunit c/vacuolar-type H+-ATPase subunit K
VADPAPTLNRSTWLFVFAGMVNAVVLYALILWMIGRTGASAPATASVPRVAFSIAAAACLFASMAWTRMRLRPQVRIEAEVTEPVPPPDAGRFGRDSIVSLALAETAAIVGFAQGFLLHNGVVAYLPFAVGTLAIMLFDVLPLGLRFWRQMENDRGSGSIG